MSQVSHFTLGHQMQNLVMKRRMKKKTMYFSLRSHFSVFQTLKSLFWPNFQDRMDEGDGSAWDYAQKTFQAKVTTTSRSKMKLEVSPVNLNPNGYLMKAKKASLEPKHRSWSKASVLHPVPCFPPQIVPYFLNLWPFLSVFRTGLRRVPGQ